MRPRSYFALATCTVLSIPACSIPHQDSEVASRSDEIVDVPQTPVERQSIGNCWLYAEAAWVESMHLSATGESFTASESYWTYWHWFDQIAEDDATEVQTGGWEATAHRIITMRGLVRQADFVLADNGVEMSTQQKKALDAVNAELRSGRLSTASARADRKLVRSVLDKAWGLPTATRTWLDTAFGDDASRTLDDGAEIEGTPILSPAAFRVRYTERTASSRPSVPKDTNLSQAIRDWHSEQYPSSATNRRNFMIRVQRALHDRQPVVLSWAVDFNALEQSTNARRGSFNMTTLGASGGPGHQGGHMVVLEDYQAMTQNFGLLAAGTTLDPNQAADRAKLEAALLPSTTVQFLRVKNSWGTVRADRSSVPGFPGYHDLYMDYLNGPIAWCPDAEDPSPATCRGRTVPLWTVMMPPGY
ncbi:hypothetical protein LZC95_05315 [Pendulispora brunnea]|uniref:Uncharacterized protein n=1 Tax=Pendulispora brunnea TaxID=2905690 RepID=A0ABZ2KCD2_9BACT